MLVSKIQTYFCDKMHLKKVNTNKHGKLGLSPKMTGLFVITFFRCILSQRKVCIFETSIKFCIFYTDHDLFQKFFLDLYYRMMKFSGGVPSKVIGAKIFFNACLGLPTHRHNYCKMIEFAKKIFSKSTPPTRESCYYWCHLTMTFEM
jgi:hypothetical protein